MPWARRNFPSPIGPLTAWWSSAGLKRLAFSATLPEEPEREEPESEDDPHGLGPALAAYFAGELSALDALAVAPEGPIFQQRVWEQLRRIPAGSTLSYGELAGRLSLGPAAARAVGAACGANPVGVVIPCHRVVGAKGDLTGYAGGIERKRWLLVHERAPVVRQQELFGRAAPLR